MSKVGKSMPLSFVVGETTEDLRKFTLVQAFTDYLGKASNSFGSLIPEQPLSHKSLKAGCKNFTVCIIVYKSLGKFQYSNISIHKETIQLHNTILHLC